MPQLSIIIVNFRSLSLIDDCLTSVSRFSKILPEIIIVDNSGDDLNPILEKFPSVRPLSMGYNAGFARANNEGIRLASGDVVLLMNPDILVEDAAIENCYNDFIRSDYVACGVQLLNPDRSPQISGNYFMKGGLNHLLPLPFLGKMFKAVGNIIKVKKTHVPEAKDRVEVDWINGAFLMVKKIAIEKAGLVDEDFFLYFEETEWCSRLHQHGKLCIFGNHHVFHMQGETANAEYASSGKGYYNLYDRKGRQIMLSSFVRIRKQFGTAWFLFHLLVFFFEIPVFFIGILLQRVFFVKDGYTLEQLKGYTSNFLFVAGKSSRIISNKPYFYKA